MAPHPTPPSWLPPGPLLRSVLPGSRGSLSGHIPALDKGHIFRDHNPLLVCFFHQLSPPSFFPSRAFLFPNGSHFPGERRPGSHWLPGVLRAGPGRPTIDTDTEPSRHGLHQGCQGGGCLGLELQAALLLAGLQGATLCLQERGGTLPQQGADTVCAHTRMGGSNAHIRARTHAGTHPRGKKRDGDKPSKEPVRKREAPRDNLTPRE